jgi:hypothetical protein
MIEVFMEHSYGNAAPKEVRCGIDRYAFVYARVEEDCRQWGIRPVDFNFFGAKVVLDENLFTTEFCVSPTLQPSHPWRVGLL